MKTLIRIIFLLFAAGSLYAQPSMTDSIPPGRDLIPLLPYIFFDSGSAVIPERYVLFNSSAETESFSDTTIEGDALAHHRQILNIIGYRLKKYPSTRIMINAHDSQQPEIGEVAAVCEKRARIVYEYLATIWKIDSSRITIARVGGWPKFPSMKKDPQGIVENRRAEIASSDWEIIRPVWRWRTSSRGRATVDLYTIIQFKFMSPDAGPLNERIVGEYLYPHLFPGDCILVVGSTDNHMMVDDAHFARLHWERATAVAKGIRKKVNPEDLASFEVKYNSPETPPYSGELAEGRFFSRSVLVRVER